MADFLTRVVMGASCFVLAWAGIRRMVAGKTQLRRVK